MEGWIQQPPVSFLRLAIRLGEGYHVVLPIVAVGRLLLA